MSHQKCRASRVDAKQNREPAPTLSFLRPFERAPIRIQVIRDLSVAVGDIWKRTRPADAVRFAQRHPDPELYSQGLHDPPGHHPVFRLGSAVGDISEKAGTWRMTSE